MTPAALVGIGTVSALGAAAETFWRGILGQESAFGPISRFDASGYGSRFAGEVDDLVLDRLIPTRKRRTSTHSTQIFSAATKLAWEDSAGGLDSSQSAETGMFVGTALGGWRDGEKQAAMLLERGSTRVNQFIVSGAGCFAAATEAAELTQAQGEHLTVSNGCPSALQAITLAASRVAIGELESCVTGGTESPLSPTVVAALERSRELSTEITNPNAASAPFDRRHSGMVLSEGGAALILEAAPRAHARGARVYALVLGGSTSCDSNGLYGVDDSGNAGARAIHALLRRHDMTPGDIDYVCAHANSSPTFDRKEALVLKRAFGEFAAKIPVSSIKGVLGHPFGASGAFQTAAAAMAMQHSLIPATHNLEDPDPECDLDLVIGEPRKKEIRHALVTSYGYGGVNAYLLLRNPNL